MKSETEIKTMIGKLEAERQRLPEYSVFGDPNWPGIDSRVEALEWVLDIREDCEMV